MNRTSDAKLNKISMIGASSELRISSGVLVKNAPFVKALSTVGTHGKLTRSVPKSGVG